MAEEQAKVQAELSGFVDRLANGPIENDFQIGVVTTGVLQRARACAVGSPAHTNLYPDESGRLQLGKLPDSSDNPLSQRRILSMADPDLVEQFGFLVVQGTSGSGEEMGLQAMRLALSAPVIDEDESVTPPGNKGFLRPGARLLVVIVSDEDDCSDPAGDRILLEPICGALCSDDADCGGSGHYCLTDAGGQRRCSNNLCETPAGQALLEPVSTFVDFLHTLDDGTGTGRTREVTLAVIAAVGADGVPERCVNGSEEAQGVGVRYAEAVSQMGENGILASICDAAYRDTLTAIAERVSASSVLDLPVDPGSGALVQVLLTRDGQQLRCLHGEGFDYEPAQAGAPARITMMGECRLRASDQVRLDFVCAS